MVRRLAERIPLYVRTIVASAALTGDDALCGGVCEARCCERATRCMAVVARQIRWDVIVRFGRGGSPLEMASGASAGAHAGVIERRARQTGERDITRVAGVARGRGRDVGWRFAERVHAGIGAIVAIRALKRQHALRGSVSESRWFKRAPGRVAVVARQVRRDVVCRFQRLG